MDRSVERPRELSMERATAENPPVGPVDERAPESSGLANITDDAAVAGDPNMHRIVTEQRRIGGRAKLLELWKWILERQGPQLTVADIITYIQNELGYISGEASNADILQPLRYQPEYVPVPLEDLHYDPDMPYLDDSQWYQRALTLQSLQHLPYAHMPGGRGAKYYSVPNVRIIGSVLEGYWMH